MRIKSALIAITFSLVPIPGASVFASHHVTPVGDAARGEALAQR